MRDLLFIRLDFAGLDERYVLSLFERLSDLDERLLSQEISPHRSRRDVRSQHLQPSLLWGQEVSHELMYVFRAAEWRANMIVESFWNRIGYALRGASRERHLCVARIRSHSPGCRARYGDRARALPRAGR